MRAWLGNLWVMLALFLGTSPFALYGQTSEEIDASQNQRLLIWAGLYAIFAFMSLPYLRQMLASLRAQKPLLLLTFFTSLSALWSQLPDTTLAASAALWGTTLIAVVAAVKLPPHNMLRLLAGALALLALGSAVVIFWLPDYGVMRGIHEGLWNGLTTHKNALGRYMMMSSVIFALLGWQSSGLKRAALYLLALLCLGLMAGAQSATAYIMLVAFIVLYGCVTVSWQLQPRGRAGLLALILAIAAGGLVLLNDDDALQALLGSLGRDATLTQRTRIWSLALDAIRDHPWLGYGYEAFWDSKLGSSMSIHYTTWNVPHVHNGFLEIWLALGIPGLVLLLALCLQLLRRIMQRMEPELLILYCLVLVTGLVLNMVEFNFLRYNNIFWMLFIYVLLRSARSTDEDAESAVQPGQPPAQPLP